MKTSTSETTESSSYEERELHRQLIEQFYKTSLERYGADSEQTQRFAQQLAAYQDHGKQS